MVIYTPRGLKVRIAVPYAFALMARLAPRVKPFQILKTTEGLDSIPEALAFVACLYSYVQRSSPTEVGIIVGCAQMAGVLINRFGMYWIPGMVKLGTVFSYYCGFGFFLAIIVCVGLAMVGWQGLLAYLMARLAVGCLATLLGFHRAWATRRLIGHALTDSEFHFFNAYRFHAARVGASTELDLSDSETKEDHWAAALEEFSREWPRAVRRFAA